MYHTLLFDERGAFRRMDVCGPCWQNENTASLRERQGFTSYWHGVYEAPPPPTDPIQRDTAESLLRKLIELNDPRHRSSGYILAVMLERKRVLKVKEQAVREGQRVFVYEHPKTGDLFTIADPDLKLDELEQVQRDVASLLEHGLAPTPSAPQWPAPEEPRDAASNSPHAAPVLEPPPIAASSSVEQRG